jgi:enamine deaminase RidA (YjgF/YER057c/UK114 family)
MVSDVLRIPITATGSAVQSGGEAGLLAPELLVEQYRWCLTELTRQVAGTGFEIGDVVRMVEYVSPDARQHYSAVRDLRRATFGELPPCSVVVSRDDHAAANSLVTLDVTLARGPKSVVQTGLDHFGNVTYSAGIVCEADVYVSGFASIDLSTGRSVGRNDLPAQIRQSYESLAFVLESAGSSLADVTSVTEFWTRRAIDSSAAGGVVGGREATPRPASIGAAVVTEVCDALIRDDLMFEVVATAKTTRSDHMGESVDV